MRQVVLFKLLFLLTLAFVANGIAQSSGQDDRLKAAGTYRIQQGDKLSIKFFNNSELNEPSVTVRPDGYINLQIINEVRAAGLSIAELKKELERAYEEILLDPIISVAVIDFIPPHVYIAGQVTKPGRYDLREAKTLMQGIFLAGGFTREANRRMVIHARPKGMDDWTIGSADVLKILSAKDDEKDLELRDGDYVFVPDSKTSQFNRAVEVFRGLMPRIF